MLTWQGFLLENLNVVNSRNDDRVRTDGLMMRRGHRELEIREAFALADPTAEGVDGDGPDDD